MARPAVSGPDAAAIGGAVLVLQGEPTAGRAAAEVTQAT
jgi:hypothetical protein